MTQKQIYAAADRAGWNCTIRKNKEDWYICFNTDTHFGQDACFEYNVQTLEQIKDEIYDTYTNYDPSEEAMLWVGEDGHGKNGAPDDIRDIITDMEEVEEMLNNLYLALNGRQLESEREDKFQTKANDLKKECLSELLSNIHNAKPSKYIMNTLSFANPDTCSLFEEITYYNSNWILHDGSGLQYSIDDMPLQQLCEMVDNILKQ